MRTDRWCPKGKNSMVNAALVEREWHKIILYLNIELLLQYNSFLTTVDACVESSHLISHLKVVPH